MRPQHLCFVSCCKAGTWTAAGHEDDRPLCTSTMRCKPCMRLRLLLLMMAGHLVQALLNEGHEAGCQLLGVQGSRRIPGGCQEGIAV